LNKITLFTNLVNELKDTHTDKTNTSQTFENVLKVYCCIYRLCWKGMEILHQPLVSRPPFLLLYQKSTLC